MLPLLLLSRLLLRSVVGGCCSIDRDTTDGVIVVKPAACLGTTSSNITADKAKSLIAPMIIPNQGISFLEPFMVKDCLLFRILIDHKVVVWFSENVSGKENGAGEGNMKQSCQSRSSTCQFLTLLYQEFAKRIFSNFNMPMMIGFVDQRYVSRF